MEMLFIFHKNEEVNSNQDNPQEVSKSALNSSVSRSGLIRQTNSTNSKCSQVDFAIFLPFANFKLCTEELKRVLAETSVRAQISPEKAPKAALAFSKKFYCQNYYLFV